MTAQQRRFGDLADDVPSFLFPDGDLYWGREHLPRIREMLAA